MTDAYIVQKGDSAPSHIITFSEKENKYHFEALERVNEAVTQVPIASGMSSDDLTEPPRFTDPLITRAQWDVENFDHLREVAVNDPIASALTFGVVRDALADGWRYVKEFGDAEEVAAAKAIHDDFEQCHANFWLMQAAIWARVHGDSLLYTGKKAFRTDVTSTPNTGNALDMFSKEYFILPKEWKDDMGRPIHIKVWPNPENKAQFKKIPYDDFIHFIFNPRGRDYAGYSSLRNVWTYITLIRHTAYNIGWAYQKFGMGAIVIFLSGRLTAETEASLEKAMKNIGGQRAGILDANLIDRIEYIGPQASIANNAPEIINSFQGMVATGSRFPKTMMTGDSTGQISAGDVQDRAYAGSLDTQIQKLMVPYIKELARRRGHPTDWKIEFNARYAKDEKEVVSIDLLKAQAERERATAESQKKNSELNVNFSGLEDEKQGSTPKNIDKTNNPGGVQG